MDPKDRLRSQAGRTQTSCLSSRYYCYFFPPRSLGHSYKLSYIKSYTFNYGFFLIVTIFFRSSDFFFQSTSCSLLTGGSHLCSKYKFGNTEFCPELLSCGRGEPGPFHGGFTNSIVLHQAKPKHLSYHEPVQPVKINQIRSRSFHLPCDHKIFLVITAN